MTQGWPDPESSVARDGSPHSYSGTNLDNEYGQIDGQALTYDDAGNLSVDEDGRHYYNQAWGQSAFSH
ncbi:MAG: hypothetical protein QUV05_13780 [Phycisphaerae bacterium]|nr:hypothetical protein [Phycisphaerae bacterium]